MLWRKFLDFWTAPSHRILTRFVLCFWVGSGEIASCSASDVSPLANELNRRMLLPSMPPPKPVSESGRAGGDGAYGTGPPQAQGSAPGSSVRRRY